MKVSWYAPTAPGHAGFAASHIDVPGRFNFIQAAIYRLKLTDIPGRPGMELYPTLEVVPSNAKTDPFLAHSAVPVTFTNEDFDQVASGNYVVKVIYLPEPQFQDLATTGPDEVVSSRLEPGVDPIAEAHRRGNILLVVRIGNIDLELANSPGMDAPNPFSNPGCPPGGCPVPGMAGPMSGPGMPQMPAATMGMPGMLPAQQPANGTGPVSKLPETSGIQQAQYKSLATTSPAQPAGQSSDMKTSGKKSSSSGRWWWPGGDSDKK
jgi:hypothetical protein